MSPSWINFITLNDPSLNPYVLPAIPGVEGSQDIHTISAQTLLVGNRDLSERSVFALSSYIYQHRLDLMKYDIMYRSIHEVFDVSGLLYPLHEGTDAYFRRHQPTFVERYADVLALVFSIGVVFFGIVQAVRNRMRKKKKERIDLYFLEFLDIKASKIARDEMITSLVQQELSNLLFGN